MGTPSTPTDSGTGTNDAQGKILALLNAEDGDTGTGGDEPALQGEDGADGEQPHGADEPGDEVNDEAAPEGADEPDDTVESDDPEDDPDETEPNAEPATVEIDGTPVAIEEVKKGYLRQADYTRKTQALAEQRQQFEQEANEVRVERAQYAQLLEPLAKMLTAGDEPEPNWDQLYAQDPATASHARYLWDKRQAERQQKLQAIHAEQQRLAETAQREHFQRLQVQVEEARTKLPELIPTWKDPKIAASDRAKIKDFAKGLGYTDDELKLVTDPRAVVGLYKAMKYDELQARRAAVSKPQVSAVRPMRPGSSPGKQDTRARDFAQNKQRLAKTGSVKDAAAAIKSLL